MVWPRSARSSVITLAVVGAAFLSACGEDGPALHTQSPSSEAPEASESAGGGAFDVTAAEQYCTDVGGMLVDRVANWNTNADPSAWLELAGRATFCEFETDEEDSTRIAVDLVTLYSDQPTIAAVAYLSQITTTSPEQVGQNPAEFSCRVDYAATADYGNTATVGGWVDTGQPVFEIMNMCVFPDLSAIDTFGLWYHANGVVRGRDLAEVMRYQPGRRLPAMFESQT